MASDDISTGTPWMAENRLDRTLPRGIGISLFARDIAAEVAFCRDVLGAMILDANDRFAAIELCGSIVMIRADAAAAERSGGSRLAADGARGTGIELRVMGLDPDRVAARAAAAGRDLLSAAADGGNGLRECHLRDPEGYLWVPCQPAR